MINNLNESKSLTNMWSINENASKLFTAKSDFVIPNGAKPLFIKSGDTLYVESTKYLNSTKYNVNVVNIKSGEIVFESETVTTENPAWTEVIMQLENEEPAAGGFDADVASVIERFDNKIFSSAEVHDFFYALMYELDLNFHPDTNFDDYIKGNSSDQLFSQEQCLILNGILGDCFEVCEKEGSDIYEIGLKIAQELMGINPNDDAQVQEKLKPMNESRRILEERTVYSMEQLTGIENWIKSIWARLESADEKAMITFFNRVESELGEDVASFIDRQVSADYMHYNQNGNTVGGGGKDTYEFIENFENIKGTVEHILNALNLK